MEDFCIENIKYLKNTMIVLCFLGALMVWINRDVGLFIGIIAIVLFFLWAYIASYYIIF